MVKGNLFVLSAPSGAGKTTVLKRVMAELSGVAFSVSHTTRSPRTGEHDGVDYHFISRDRFLTMRQKGIFIESAEVHDNLYGTSRLAVEEQIGAGYDIILDIDVQGARIIKGSTVIRATYIFLAPPSLHELERRLRSRSTDDEKTIATRLSNARKEMAAAREYDYLIVNDTVDDAVTLLQAVIYAERARNRRDKNGKPLELLSDIE